MSRSVFAFERLFDKVATAALVALSLTVAGATAVLGA